VKHHTLEGKVAWNPGKKKESLQRVILKVFQRKRQLRLQKGMNPSSNRKIGGGEAKVPGVTKKRDIAMFPRNCDWCLSLHSLMVWRRKSIRRTGNDPHVFSNFVAS